jgi:hypothetical protein
MNSEQQADMRGVKLTREERKALRVADMRSLTREEVEQVKTKAEAKIKANIECYDRQVKNGLKMKADVLQRNNASHILTVECADEILN